MECISAVKSLILAALPVDWVTRMELCSVTALAKNIRRGAVGSAFLMLIKSANPVATMEVDTDVGGTDGMMVQFEMNLLIGISFAMNMQMSSNHQVFLPNMISNMILSC